MWLNVEIYIYILHGFVEYTAAMNNETVAMDAISKRRI